MAATEAHLEPPRAHALSVVLTVAAIVAGLLLAPLTATAAEPLPAGTYEVEVGTAAVVVHVDERGIPRLEAPDDLVVRLQFDERGRVLDEFEVTAPTGAFRATVGSGWVRLDELDNAAFDGEVVSIVSDCSPNGLVALAVGMPNKGVVVSHAASGMRMQSLLTDPITGDVVALRADFGSTEGAHDYCAQVDELVPSVEEIRALVAERRAAARGDLDAAAAAQAANVAAEGADGE